MNARLGLPASINSQPTADVFGDLGSFQSFKTAQCYLCKSICRWFKEKVRRHHEARSRSDTRETILSPMLTACVLVLPHSLLSESGWRRRRVRRDEELRSSHPKALHEEANHDLVGHRQAFGLTLWNALERFGRTGVLRGVGRLQRARAFKCVLIHCTENLAIASLYPP